MTGDLNDDGLADVVARSASGAGTYVLLNDGGGIFVQSQLISPALATAGPNYIKDFNNDGIADLYTSSGSSFNVTGRSATLAGFSLASQSSARSALSTFETAAQSIATEQGIVGAALSRISQGLRALSARNLGTQEAASRITDIDFAQEAASLTRTSILRQTAGQVLSSANLEPQIALQILYGVATRSGSSGRGKRS